MGMNESMFLGVAITLSLSKRELLISTVMFRQAQRGICVDLQNFQLFHKIFLLKTELIIY